MFPIRGVETRRQTPLHQGRHQFTRVLLYTKYVCDTVTRISDGTKGARSLREGDHKRFLDSEHYRAVVFQPVSRIYSGAQPAGSDTYQLGRRDNHQSGRYCVCPIRAASARASKNLRTSSSPTSLPSWAKGLRKFLRSSLKSNRT
jgi:hypothetical protein